MLCNDWDWNYDWFISRLQIYRLVMIWKVTEKGIAYRRVSSGLCVAEGSGVQCSSKWDAAV